jgi:hypothetical protein
MKTYNITYTTAQSLGARVVEIQASTTDEAVGEMYELGLVELDGSDDFEYTIQEVA